ncbi:hypothetical protein DFH09DRAFT_1440766 [Mycena vulgaris]|nr:hypothetical protein DFH09DRAFT_1440766 [Mycena vulgaris]
MADYSPRFTHFPSEIVDAIVQHIQPMELLGLCHVGDRRVHNICVPYIYRDVELSTSRAVAQFCETLRSSGVLSDLVEALKINCDDDAFARAPIPHRIGWPLQVFDDNNAMAAGYATAIGGLHNLGRLKITRPESLLAMLPHTALPSLRSLDTSFSEHLESFLRNHPHLESLWIDPLDRLTQRPLKISPIHLPALREFAGPELVASAVLPGSYVTNPTIFWDSASTRQTSAAKCIARCALSQAPVTELYNVMNGWDAPNALSIAASLPALTALQFQNLHPSASPTQREAFLTSLSIALSAFPDLHMLILDEPGQRAPHTHAVFNWEWDLLQLWHGICPLLQDCTFLSGVRWQRLPFAPTVWFPVNPGQVAGCGTFAHWFLATIAQEDGVLFHKYAPVLGMLFRAPTDGEEPGRNQI